MYIFNFRVSMYMLRKMAGKELLTIKYRTGHSDWMEYSTTLVRMMFMVQLPLI